jgi:tRNA(Leu) C34 or U34 (ribose-2'-O)-methylase TrmL
MDLRATKLPAHITKAATAASVKEARQEMASRQSQTDECLLFGTEQTRCPYLAKLKYAAISVAYYSPITPMLLPIRYP